MKLSVNSPWQAIVTLALVAGGAPMDSGFRPFPPQGPIVDIIAPFPEYHVGGPTGPTDPVSVGPDRPGGGGYYGNLVVTQCQWGPCSYDRVTKRIWRDIISCPESATGGRFRATGLCDSHQGVSQVKVAPAGFIMADNYGAATCAIENAPSTLAYDLRAGSPVYIGGFDVSIQPLLGFIGTKAYFSGGAPCRSVDMADPELDVMPSPCPAASSFDPVAATDPEGRRWVAWASPGGIARIATSETSVTPQVTATPAAPPQSPTFAPSATRSPTIGLPGATSTKSPSRTPVQTRTPILIPTAAWNTSTPVTPSATRTPTMTPTATATPICPALPCRMPVHRVGTHPPRVVMTPNTNRARPTPTRTPTP